MKPTTRNFWLTAGLLALTVAAAQLNQRRTPDSLAASLESIPARMDGWQMSHSDTLDAHVLEVLVPTSYLARTYTKAGRQVQVFVAFYAMQRAGENMHSPKNCLPGSGWEIWKQDSLSLQVEGRPTPVNQLSIQNSGKRELVFYWYQNKRRVVASEAMGKMLLVRDGLVEGRTSGSIARVMVPDTPEDAANGAAFAKCLMVELQRCFGR
jgi:EpsI family protein